MKIPLTVLAVALFLIVGAGRSVVGQELDVTDSGRSLLTLTTTALPQLDIDSILADFSGEPIPKKFVKYTADQGGKEVGRGDLGLVLTAAIVVTVGTIILATRVESPDRCRDASRCASRRFPIVNVSRILRPRFSAIER